MPRRLSAVPFIPLLLALGGCTQLGIAPQAVEPAGGTYVCRVGDNVDTPGPQQRLTVQPDPQRGQLVMKLGQGDWQALDPVARSAGRVYANASYAWRSDTGVLTDIARIETYNCTSDATASRQVR
jgi:hypothetical protein